MGCFWGKRDNNSYVSTHKTDKVCTADGKCYNYNDVFVDEVDPGYSNTCGQTCYVACSCNTSNGWYSTCQGSDCFSVTDTRYAGQPNAASASRSISDVASISASGTNSGISALASGATTCYKKKTCEEGGYYDSVPADQKCSSKSYNGYSCYTGCSYKTCSDYGYNSSIPSGKTCTPVYPRSGLTCYKDCKDDTYYKVNFRFLIQPCQSSISWEQRIVFEVKMVNQMDDHDVYSFSNQIDCTTAGSDYGFTFHMRAGTYITKEFSIYVSGSNLRPNIDNVSGSVRAPLQGDSFEIDSKFSNSGYYYVYSLTWP